MSLEESTSGGATSLDEGSERLAIPDAAWRSPWVYDSQGGMHVLTPDGETHREVVSYFDQTGPLVAALEELRPSLSVSVSAVLRQRMVGPGPWTLDLSVSLSPAEGDTLLSLLGPGRSESPDWETGSHDGEAF
jgi:hypothetical protein